MRPDRYQKIERNARVAVQIAEETWGMVARMATEEVVQERWPKLVAMFQIWERFQQHSGRTFPVVILSSVDEVLKPRAPRCGVLEHRRGRVDSSAGW